MTMPRFQGVTVRVDHVEDDCPGDGRDIECHDGNLYGPRGEENCSGADVKVGNCRCACHD